MKRCLALPLFFLVLQCFVMPACSKDSITPNDTVFSASASYYLQNRSYGSDPQQIMDIWLPAGRNASSTKVFVLIHGGGWGAGDKSDYTGLFNSLKAYFPDHAILNLNYRLGTAESPGYPKQLADVAAALGHARLPRYGLSPLYFLFGASAGAHLAMLYGYAFDSAHNVKGLCNTVGPADLTDPSYVSNPYYRYAFVSLLGNVTYAQDSSLYAETSPVKRVTTLSPPTISFYGAMDSLVPSTQVALLNAALTEKGVYHEATMYSNEGHSGWNANNTQDWLLKIIDFVNQHF